MTASWMAPRPAAAEPEAQADPDPVARSAEAFRERLGEWGIELLLDTALYYQRASDTVSGQRDLGTFAWGLLGEWRLVDDTRWGRGALLSEWVGSVGLDYGTQETLSGNVGAIHTLNANVQLDPAALTQLAWAHVLPRERVSWQVGRIDLKSYFDANRVANDPYGQFFAGDLENNPSIPFPAYGGLGAMWRVAPGEEWYFQAGAGQSDADEPFAFWESLDDDAWYGLLEVGVRHQVPGLGRGDLRLTPWFNHLDGEGGWGVGVGLDQELGCEQWIGFLRFGAGDADVTPVKLFASGGLMWAGPFGREDDALGLGVAWSDPSGGSDQTLIEIYYRLQVTPWLGFTPNLELLCEPPGHGCVAVGGLRLALRF